MACSLSDPLFLLGKLDSINFSNALHDPMNMHMEVGRPTTSLKQVFLAISPRHTQSKEDSTITHLPVYSHKERGYRTSKHPSLIVFLVTIYSG